MLQAPPPAPPEPPRTTQGRDDDADEEDDDDEEEEDDEKEDHDEDCDEDEEDEEDDAEQGTSKPKSLEDDEHGDEDAVQAFPGSSAEEVLVALGIELERLGYRRELSDGLRRLAEQLGRRRDPGSSWQATSNVVLDGSRPLDRWLQTEHRQSLGS